MDGLNGIAYKDEFQFLIGRIASSKLGYEYPVVKRVSIPHR